MAVRLTKKELNSLTNGELMIHYWRLNPDLFVMEVLHIELTWLQRLTIRKALSSKFVMILWSRGLGKTFMGALILLTIAILYPNTKCGIFGPAFRQAEMLIDYIEQIIENAPLIRNSIIYTSANKPVSRMQYKAILKFRNGSFILAMPLGEGNKVRGQRLNFVWMEEYAQLDEDVIKLVITPMLNIKLKGRENRIFMSTTAYYSFNHAYKQYLIFNLEKMHKNPRYYLSEFTYLDHLRIQDPPYEYDLEILMKQKNDPTMTEDDFKMENLCYFPLDSQGVFSARLIDSCTPKNEPVNIRLNPITSPEIFYVFGVDSARTEGGDNFALQIVECNRRTQERKVVNCICANGAEYPVQANIIRFALANYINVELILMDMRGGGQALKDILAQPWTDPFTGKYHLPVLDVEDEKFRLMNGIKVLKMFPSSQPAINLMFSLLKSGMERQQVLFPMDIMRHGDKLIDEAAMEVIRTKRELYMIKAEPRGNLFKFDVPKGHKKDRAFALGLANMAGQEILESQRITISSDNLAEGFWMEAV